MPVSTAVRHLLVRLKGLREAKGWTPSEVDDRLMVGPGWTEHLESGAAEPSLDLTLAVLDALDVDPAEFLGGIRLDGKSEVPRLVSALTVDEGLVLRFPYGDYDAAVPLPGATVDEYFAVLSVLRKGLARIGAEAEGALSTALQTDAVAQAFLHAVSLWPRANPSDVWWFLIYRAFCDPLNHPATAARRDFGQSWKRTGGWALEEVLVRHYAPFLLTKGVRLFIGSSDEKRICLSQLRVADRLEAAKVDVLLCGLDGGAERCFGVVHVKASFAERRTDDVPMSKGLVDAGYTSPLWTMDCKSFPAAKPVNKGELGAAKAGVIDRRSAKRKDIEDDGYFSACFSYNRNTVPTPADQGAAARVIPCDFSNPDDSFAGFVISQWEGFRDS